MTFETDELVRYIPRNRNVTVHPVNCASGHPVAMTSQAASPYRRCMMVMRFITKLVIGFLEENNHCKSKITWIGFFTCNHICIKYKPITIAGWFLLAHTKRR